MMASVIRKIVTVFVLTQLTTFSGVWGWTGVSPPSSRVALVVQRDYGSRKTHSSATSSLVLHHSRQHSRATGVTIMKSSMEDFDLDAAGPFLLAAVALALGISAQGFINGMLEGDQGLGAFLSDGRGYGKSGFRPNNNKENQREDPLPWLSLPKLDFVEVAGQGASEEEVFQKLESLRYEMNVKLQEGNVREATLVRRELERLCEETGFEFKAED